MVCDDTKCYSWQKSWLFCFCFFRFLYFHTETNRLGCSKQFRNVSFKRKTLFTRISEAIILTVMLNRKTKEFFICRKQTNIFTKGENHFISVYLAQETTLNLSWNFPHSLWMHYSDSFSFCRITFSGRELFCTVTLNTLFQIKTKSLKTGCVNKLEYYIFRKIKRSFEQFCTTFIYSRHVMRVTGPS